jgi:hypothetical protein
MKDADIYPVSFFSRAFDLMQKIQSDFHLLEADQVELFASQMKKHQALILSIHRQMRNIESVTPSVTPPASSAPSEKQAAPEKPTVKIIEEPTAKFPAEKKPAKPIPNPPPVSETVKKTGKSTVTIPVTISPPSVNEALEKKSLSDLRKAFSLNDRFRYRRELFGEDEEIMNKVISVLNGKESYKESIRFLDEKLHWDFSNPTVKDFIKKLELRFM